MPINITSPLSSISKILHVEKSFSGTTGISIGDLLKATVVKNIDGDQLLIRLNDSDVIPAKSAVALQVGETMTVKVEQLRPSLTLSIISQNLPETEKVGEYLRLQRANPTALVNMISELSARLNADSLSPFLPFHSHSNLKNILKLLEALSMSKKTAGSNQFIRDYVGNLGLSWESSLKKALTGAQVDPAKSGLKGALMTLAEECRLLTANGGLIETDILTKLKAVEQMTLSSIRTIESEQVVNVLSQENEGRYLLQIPLQFPSGARTADLCIEFEEKGKKEGTMANGFRVIFLLDMDALGDISIEASIHKSQVNCKILCTDHDACQFISNALTSLTEGLTGLGYRIASINCLFQKELSDVREEFNRFRELGGKDAVNIFI